jgi:hypothetical protein
LKAKIHGDLSIGLLYVFLWNGLRGWLADFFEQELGRGRLLACCTIASIEVEWALDWGNGRKRYHIELNRVHCIGHEKHSTLPASHLPQPCAVRPSPPHRAVVVINTSNPQNHRR